MFHQRFVDRLLGVCNVVEEPRLAWDLIHDQMIMGNLFLIQVSSFLEIFASWIQEFLSKQVMNRSLRVYQGLPGKQLLFSLRVVRCKTDIDVPGVITDFNPAR